MVSSMVLWTSVSTSAVKVLMASDSVFPLLDRNL